MLSHKARPRKLKIYQKWQNTTSWRIKILPEIRLCGIWLREMGFEYGQRITVRLEDDKLIIEPEGGLRKNPQLEIWED